MTIIATVLLGQNRPLFAIVQYYFSPVRGSIGSSLHRGDARRSARRERLVGIGTDTLVRRDRLCRCRRRDASCASALRDSRHAHLSWSRTPCLSDRCRRGPLRDDQDRARGAHRGRSARSA